MAQNNMNIPSCQQSDCFAGLLFIVLNVIDWLLELGQTLPSHVKRNFQFSCLVNSQVGEPEVLHDAGDPSHGARPSIYACRMTLNTLFVTMEEN
jgi:hypothetical protein